MKLRVMANSIMAATAVVALAGFGAPAFAQQTVLKMTSWQKDEKGVGDWFNSLIAQFEKNHPGVKIEFTKIEAANYAPTLTTLFASGSPPDIVHVAGFDYPRFAGNGWLENLDPYIKNSKLDLTGWSGQDRCKWQGKTVCIVNLYFGFTLAYNEQLLQKAGIAVPKNYTEFLAAIKKLTLDTNGDGIIDQYGTGHEIGDGVSWYVTEMLNYMLPQRAFWTNAAGEITMDTPQMVAALTDWKEINLSGAIPRDPKGGDTRALFREGKLALKVDGPWLYPILNAAKPEIRPHLKITTSPFDPPVGGISNVLAMAAEIPDARKRLVWDFIALATSDENQSLLASLGDSLPPSPRADLASATKAKPALTTLMEAARAASKAGVERIPPGMETRYNEMARMVTEEVQRMIIGNLNPVDVAKTMQQRAVRIQKGS
jgi:multiple sugar transport system substrate-binding protein